MPSFEIVGAHFRPPAKAILLGLPQNNKTFLRAEPQNQFDSNAIQILIDPNSIPKESYENLNSELARSGKDMDDILSEPEIHLGYIRKEFAKTLKEEKIVEDNKTYSGTFLVDFRGKPQIETDFEEIPQS